MPITQDFLKSLSAQAPLNAYNAHVPTIGIIQFLPVTCKQDCSLLKYKNYHDGFTGVKILQELTGIILSNCVDKDAAKRLTTLDRNAILVQMRYNLLQSSPGAEEEIVKILKLIDQYPKLVDSVTDVLNKVTYPITENGITIQLHIPSLQQEYLYYSNVDAYLLGVTRENLPTTIYQLEIAKFIKTIQVGSDAIDFASEYTNIRGILEVMHVFPASLVNKITSVIKEVRILEDHFVELPTVSPIDILPYRVRIDSNIFNT